MRKDDFLPHFTTVVILLTVGGVLAKVIWSWFPWWAVFTPLALWIAYIVAAFGMSVYGWYKQRKTDDYE